jgi:hypothetical protein
MSKRKTIEVAPEIDTADTKVIEVPMTEWQKKTLGQIDINGYTLTGLNQSSEKATITETWSK